MRKTAIIFLYVLLGSGLYANGFYVGGGADINISYAGGKYLRNYFKRTHAFDIKRGIVPGYDINAILGYTCWKKNKSALAIETNLGNSMIDYTTSWKTNSPTGTSTYFNQRWNKGINWSFGLKYSYGNLSLTIAPLLLFKIKNIETSVLTFNGQVTAYDYKSSNYEDYNLKFDLYLKLEYGFKMPYCVLCPYIVFQPELTNVDYYDFNTSTVDARIYSFSAGLCVYYNIKSKRR